MADRRRVGGKDMAWTMAIVLVVVLLIALYNGGFSFAPGGSTSGDSTIPTAKVLDGFEHANATMDFPVIVPGGIPDSWHPNSFTVADAKDQSVRALPTVRGGWVTADGTYIELVESSGTPDELLKSEFGIAAPSSRSVTAGDATWSVGTGVRREAAWYRAEGATTLLITGDAAKQDFVTLAEAVAR